MHLDLFLDWQVLLKEVITANCLQLGIFIHNSDPLQAHLGLIMTMILPCLSLTCDIKVFPVCASAFISSHVILWGL